MLTDNIENVCKEFDERLSRANSLLGGLHEKSSEWKNAFDERAKILDSVDKDMRDFFFQNSGFINVKNGRKISNMVYDAATLESGEKEFSFLLYEWYSQYEELLMQSFKFGWFAKGHGMQVTKARIIPQNVLDDFDRRLSNGENYNKVTKEFEDFLYENSRFQLKACVDSPASKRSVGGGRKRTNLLDKLIISPYNIFSGEGGENCGTNKNIKDKDLCGRRTVEEILGVDKRLSGC